MTSPQVYTVAMADLYAKQGYLRKAAQIYSHLMDMEPHREDLRQALEEINRKLKKRAAPTHKELGLLLREWEALLKKQKAQKRKR